MPLESTDSCLSKEISRIDKKMTERIASYT
jgi:hypothetical protein